MLASLPQARRFAAAILGAALLLAAAPGNATAESPAEASAGPLVDAAWLQANLDRDDLVVLDVRNQLGGGSEAVYRAGHIPGAVYSDYLKAGWRTEIDGVPAQLPRMATLEALIGELGISNDSHVVIVAAGTDALDMSSATRVYWTFKVLGHDQVSILDGGYRAYVADPARPVEIGWVDPLPDIFDVDFRPELLADRAAVEAAHQAGRPLVDNRPLDYFLGKKRHTWAKRAGTIPGAISLPESQLIVDGHVVTAAAAAEVFAQAGLGEAGQSADSEIITFCNTGHWSTLGWFVQSEILGRKHVKVYDGSMVDWTSAAELPVARLSVVTQ